MKTVIIIIITIFALLAIDKFINLIDQWMGKKENGIKNILRWLLFGLIGIPVVAFLAYLYFGLPILAFFKNPADSFKLIGFAVLFLGLLVAVDKIANKIKNINLTPRNRSFLEGIILIIVVFLFYWLIKLGSIAGIFSE